MKFAEYIQDNYFKHHEPNKDRQEDMKLGWEGCKNEITKIIFLNTKINGKKSIDVNKLVEEIEKL